MIFRNKKIFVLIGIFVLVVIFLPVNFAQAGPDGSWWAGALSWIFISIAAALGKLLIIIMKAVNYFFVESTDFDPNDKVTYGWIVVRDLCNMFFILVLLIIAFATILRIENYNVKKTLPKLLIMAVLINFSKTICFFLIDFSQVIMFTFANGFAGTDSNFVNALGLQHLNSISENSEFDNITFDVLYAIIFTLIIVIITTIVMIMLLVILLMRMIMFWILTILSPIAFLAFAIPGAQKYTSQWWGEFTKYLIVGPVLAFFVWLALIISQEINKVIIFTDDVNKGNIKAMIAEFSKPGHLYQYVLVIGLLIGALKISQQLGVMGGSIGMNMANAIKSRGLGLARKAALAPVAGALKGAGMLTSFGARKFSKHYFEIRPTKIIGGIKSSLDRTKIKDEQAVQQRGGKLLGKGGLRGVLGGWGAGESAAEQYFTGFLGIKGIKNAVHNIRWGQGSRKKLQEKYDTIKGKELKPKEGRLVELENNYQSPEERKKTVTELKKVDEQIKEFSEQAETETDKAKAEELAAKVEGLLNRKEKLELDIKKSIETKDIREQKEKIKKEIEDIMENKIKPAKEAIAHAMPPRAFEARAGRTALIGEEKAKIRDVKNDKELIQLYKDAEAKGDKYRMAAITERLFEDTNGNELLNDYGYESSAIGLHQFVKDQFVKTGLMDQNEALQTQADFSEIAQRVNHWEMAKTVGVNESGELVSMVKEIIDKKGNVVGYDDSEHAHAAAAEIFKIDPQVIMRSLNRLAMGGEMPDGKGGREFNLSTLGKILVKGLTSQFTDHGKRMLTNTAYNLSKPHVQAKLRELHVPQTTIAIIKGKGEEEGEVLDPGAIKEGLKKIDEHITKVDEEGKLIHA